MPPSRTPSRAPILFTLGIGALTMLALTMASHSPDPAPRSAAPTGAAGDPPDLRFEVPAAALALWSFGPPAVERMPGDAFRGERRSNASAYGLRSRVDAFAARLEQMRTMTARQASAVTRMLEVLRAQGTPAVTAIEAFLRRGNDVDFAKIAGGEQIGHRTLRQAMIDTLQKIGGSAAMEVELQQLDRTREPVEIAMVARGLDERERLAHRDEVIRAVDDALHSAEYSWARTSSDVAPLFDVLSEYGGEQAVEILERSAPRWAEYALIALAELPKGAGISTLTSLAATDAPPVADAALPLQILAQSALDHPEAADALVDLARAGRIPDEVWQAMGDALGGKRLQLSSARFDGTPLATGTASNDGRPWKSYYVEWLNVRYEQDAVSDGWSAEQMEHQVAVIGDLLDATSSPAALQALEQALASLEHGGRS